MELRDKTAVVTGATRGIGFAFSRALVDKGARVYGFARSQADLLEAGSRLGSRFFGMQCDVTEAAQVDHAIGLIESEAGVVDVLINNAGVGLHCNVDEMTDEDWSRLLGTNLTGVFNCTRSVVPLMKKRNEDLGFGGHIVNIASVAGLIGNPGLSAYNATKYGLRGFSDALMKELRYDGIKVTCVYPGSIQTSFFDDIEGAEAHDGMLQPGDVAATLLHILELPDNCLISDIVIRVLRPKR
ncbi:MAG: SDR family NAD(P)-dependent oxidoreductase [Rhodothermales bacterium]